MQIVLSFISLEKTTGPSKLGQCYLLMPEIEIPSVKEKGIF